MFQQAAVCGDDSAHGTSMIAIVGPPGGPHAHQCGMHVQVSPATHTP